MQTYDRSLSARLAAGEALSALFVKLPGPAQVESAGHAGFDVVVVDTEHGPADGLELEHHLRAAAAVGLPALVRLPSGDPAHVLQALDAGATGVVVPHVLDAASAEAVVAASHYPPRGRRGLATSTRAGGYGAVPLAEHLRRAAAETCVVVQIEDAEAVPRADEILAVEGVSAVLIGTADLALSLGRPGSPPHAEVEAAVDRVLGAAARASVPVMAVADDAAEAARWRARGATTIASVATRLIHTAFAAAAAESARESAIGAGVDGAPAREPLVLLAGTLGDASLWDEVLALLPGDVEPRPARIDLDDSIPEMAQSVLAAVPPRFALAGHSLGAIVALEIVRRAPERVTRLALLNASARAGSPEQQAAWEAMRRRVEEGDFDGLVHDFARANVPVARRGDAALVGQVERMAHAVGPDGLLRQLAAQRTRPDNRALLPRVAQPTLVLTGAADEVAPPERQHELVAGLPQTVHATLDGVGHMSPLEDPAAVAARLGAWLTDRPGGPSIPDDAEESRTR